MGTPIQPHGQAVQRYLPGADAEYHAPCLPPYLLQQHGKIGYEPKDAPISDGAQRYRGDVKYLHAPWAGRCHGRVAPDGGLGECQKGAGKEQGGEARLAEDVPGNLIGNNEALCYGGVLFLFAIYQRVLICGKI